MRGGVGVLGGTFDPVHLAHLRIAEEVREACALDEIRFVPAAQPPHKLGVAISDAVHRRRMLELAVAGTPGFRVWPVELERPGPSFTVDTVQRLRDEIGPDRPIVLIMGFDQFAEFHTWRTPDVICGLCDLVVVSRPPVSDTKNTQNLQEIPVVSQLGFCYRRDSERFVHSSGHWVRSLVVTALDIAATNLRAAVRDGRSIRFLVPDAVEAYVRAERLYREDPTL